MFVRGCACRTSKFWLSIYLLSFGSHTNHQYINFVQKHPSLLNLGAFYDNKNTPNLCKLGIFVCNEPNTPPPPGRYTKICKTAPQKEGTYMYTKSMWEPFPWDGNHIFQQGNSKET